VALFPPCPETQRRAGLGPRAAVSGLTNHPNHSRTAAKGNLPPRRCLGEGGDKPQRIPPVRPHSGQRETNILYCVLIHYPLGRFFCHGCGVDKERQMQKGSTSKIYSKTKPQTGSGRHRAHTQKHGNKNRPGLTELSKLNTNTNEH